jgi:hypothetical protein
VVRADTGKGALAQQRAAKHDAEIKAHAKERLEQAGYEKIDPLSDEEAAELEKRHSKPRAEGEGDDE